MRVGLLAVALSTWVLLVAGAQPAGAQQQYGHASGIRGGYTPTVLWVPPSADRARIIVPGRAAERHLIRERRPMGFGRAEAVARVSPLGRGALRPERAAVIAASQRRDVARARVHRANAQLDRAITRPASNARELSANGREIMRRAGQASVAARNLATEAERETEARYQLEVAETPPRGPLGFMATRPTSGDPPPARRGPIGFGRSSETRASVASARLEPSRTEAPTIVTLSRPGIGFGAGRTDIVDPRELEARIGNVRRAEARLGAAGLAVQRSVERLHLARLERDRALAARTASPAELRANLERVRRADEAVQRAERQYGHARELVGHVAPDVHQAREELAAPDTPVSPRRIGF